MPSIRVLLVDDNPQFVEAAVRFLSSDPEIDVVGFSYSGQDAIDKVASLKPDLVLMDLAMPGMNGLDATVKIKSQPDAPQVIVLTLHDNQEYRAASEAAGADGFIGKSEFGVQLLSQIQLLFGEHEIHGQVSV